MFPRGKPMELAAGKKSNTAQFSEMFDRPSERVAALVACLIGHAHHPCQQ